MRKLTTSLGIMVGLAWAGAASAQEAGGTAEASGQANVGMSLPGATPAAAVAGASDHDQVVGRLAVGYLGRASLGTGATAGGTYAVPGTDAAPVIGVRYWINQMLGIDAGLGLLIQGGSVEVETPDGSADLDSYTGFLFHAGVPLALASAGHFTFEIIPEANVGISSGSSADDTVDHSGFHLDIGARAGAEIHFGFIDIPQLSLQGSVGLLFALENGRTEFPAGSPQGAFDFSSSRLATTVGTNPWNIFTSNVAALYYF